LAGEAGAISQQYEDQESAYPLDLFLAFLRCALATFAVQSRDP